MRHLQPLTLSLAALLLLAILSAWLLVPRLQHASVCRAISWPSGPSFQILGTANRLVDGRYPTVQINCRWSEVAGDSPSARYALTFPNDRVEYPNHVGYSIATSPIGPHDFVIHLPLSTYPPWFSAMAIPIACRDTKEKRDLGEQTLSFRYWPAEEQPRLVTSNSTEDKLPRD